jgi:hypothetical protein
MVAKSKTWFGTRGHERWIPTPAINPDYTRTGFSAEADGLNGEGFVRESDNAHNSYLLSWPVSKTRDAIRSISDFANGVFNTQNGVNLIYWIDPMAADKNVLGMGWGFPGLACSDGVPLITEANGSGRPSAIPTSTNDWYYPARSAQYTLKSTSRTLEQYIPIPPGHSAWVGIHGSPEAQDLLQVQRVNGATTIGSPVNPAILDVSTDVRVNTEFTSIDSSGIVLQFATVVSNQTFVLSGIIVQILPTGELPIPGEYISGQGHAGCQFVGKVNTTPYSAKLDRVGATARLVETGMGL